MSEDFDPRNEGLNLGDPHPGEPKCTALLSRPGRAAGTQRMVQCTLDPGHRGHHSFEIAGEGTVRAPTADPPEL